MAEVEQDDDFQITGLLLHELELHWYGVFTLQVLFRGRPALYTTKSKPNVPYRPLFIDAGLP